MADKLTGKEKAAILLIALGQDISKEVFKYLESEEIEELYLQIAKTTKVSSEMKDRVFEEFNELMLAQQYLAQHWMTSA